MNATFGNRLVSARKQAGLSQDELVARLGGLVQKTAIAKYERGEMLPRPEVAEKLAEALDQPLDFFYSPVSVTLHNEEFRANAAMGVKTEEKLKYTIISKVERYLELEKLTHASPVFKSPVEGMYISTNQDVEEAAIEVRRAWNMGSHPIGSVMTLLEEQGVRVIDLEPFTKDFEGYSAYTNSGVPIVVVNAGATTERRRFTALHELAHLLFKFDKSLTKKEKERMCHWFAGAMLIPRDVFFETWGQYRTRFAPLELHLAKDKYGISAYAFIMRAYNLGILPNAYLTGMRNYVLTDPLEMHIGSNTSTDLPMRFDQLMLRALYEGYITLNKGAALAELSLDLFIKHYTQ